MVISQTPVSCNEVLKKFPRLFTDIIGDGERTIHGVGAPDTRDAGHAVFLATPKALTQGLQSSAGVLVVGKKDRSATEAQRGDRTVLIATQVELAMALVISEFFLRTPYTDHSLSGTHPTAAIGRDTQIAAGVRIGPHATIGRNVKLASGVYIGASAVIEEGCSIGEDSVIHPLAYIGHSTEIGKRCEVHPHSVIGKEGFGYAHDERFNHYRIPHQGRVVLEDDVHIGGCVTIDRATFGETRIQAGSKLDNQIHIAHNNQIGRNSLLTAGFTMAGSSKIGANFVTGGNTVVTGHIEICDNVQLAALSGVAKSISQPGQYGGSPLMPLQQFIKSKAAIVQLPEMRRQLSKIIKKLGLGDDFTA